MTVKEIMNIGKDFLLQPFLQFIEGLFDGSIDNSRLKAIPIANFIIGGHKTYDSIKEYNFKNKLINFFKGFIDNSVTDEEIKKHLEEINKNPQNHKQIHQYILEYIEMNTSNQNLRFGILYNAFFNKKITKELFFELTEINQRLLEPDLQLLLEFKDVNQVKKCDYKGDRLTSLGLLKKKVIDFGDDSTLKVDDNYNLSEFGFKLCEILHEHYELKKEDEDLSDLF